jgi:hypothetical protein
MIAYYLISTIYLLSSIQVFGASAASSSELPCPNNKRDLLNEFIPINFETQRNTVGLDQVEPIKSRIKNFIQSNPEWTIADIEVISSSPRIPIYTTIKDKNEKLKKVIDPKSIERNLQLAKERSQFVEKIRTEFKFIDFKTSFELSGPDYNPKDLNERFITKMSTGYEEKVKDAFKNHQDAYANLAFKKSYSELMDDKEYPNLFLVKYKPFLGFRLTIRGCENQSLRNRKINPESSKQ